MRRTASSSRDLALRAQSSVPGSSYPAPSSKRCSLRSADNRVTRERVNAANLETPLSPTYPRVGISACLLGEKVRYDGGDKRHGLLLDVLGRRVMWVPVCPEVEIGMGTPREPVQLVRRAGGVRLLTTHTGID